MKRSIDRRTVALFLWVFGIVALGQLSLHRLSIERIDEHVERVELRNVSDAERVVARRHLLADVRGDLLTASLVTFVGLLLTILGQRILNHRLERRIERERLSTESASFSRSIVDALTTHIAILDQAGFVLAVNRAWREFDGERGSALQRCPEGNNYLVASDLAAGKGCPEAWRWGKRSAACWIGAKLHRSSMPVAEARRAGFRSVPHRFPAKAAGGLS